MNWHRSCVVHSISRLSFDHRYIDQRETNNFNSLSRGTQWPNETNLIFVRTVKNVLSDGDGLMADGFLPFLDECNYDKSRC